MRREHTSSGGYNPGTSTAYYNWRPLNSQSWGDVNLEVKQPFYIEPYKTNSVIKIKTTSQTPIIQYSFNNSSWSSVTLSTSTTTSISMGSNKKIYFKCKEKDKSYNGVTFDCGDKFDVGGNILSLVYPNQTDWISPQASVSVSNCFYRMFYQNQNIQHAERLCLGSTSFNSYASNKSVTVASGTSDAPVLYSAAANCFTDMFRESSVITAPLGLGAVKACQKQSFYQMFYNCKNLKRCSRQVVGEGALQQAFAYCFGSCFNVEFLPIKMLCGFGNAGKQFEGFLRLCIRMRYPWVDTSTINAYPSGTTYNAPSEALNFLCSLDYSLDYARINMTGTNSTGIQTRGVGQVFVDCKSLRRIQYTVSNNSSWMNSTSHQNWVSGVPSSGVFEYRAPSTVSLTQGASLVPTGWTTVVV